MIKVAWSLYKSAVLLRAVYGTFATEIPVWDIFGEF